MDIRTGRTYETQAEAVAAGVPLSDIAEVNGGEVRFSSGPFKNRVYRRDAKGQLVRVDRDTGRGTWKYDDKGELVRVKA